MLYNGSNTKLTLQAYGGATGAGYNSKTILNGGNNSAGDISFINDNTTSCIMNSSGCNIKSTPSGATEPELTRRFLYNLLTSLTRRSNP